MTKSPLSSFVLLFLMTLGLPMLGCQAESNSGSSNLDMTQSALASVNDIRHMHQLAKKHGGVMRMDLADPAQHRFLLSRISATGKTRATSPQLFTMIDNMKQRHEAARKAGSDFQTLSPPPRDHIVGDFIRIPGTSNFQVTTFATIQDGADYNFVDAVVWNESMTQQLSDYGWGEAYGDGRKLAAKAKGPISPDAGAKYQIDSINLVAVNGTEESFFVLEPQAVPPGGALIHPADANNDNIVTICLNRNNGDCDYPMLTGQVVRFPMKGSITFGFPVTLVNNNASTFVKLVDINGGPKEMAFGPLANWVVRSTTDPRTVSWDIPQANGQFNNLVFKPYEDVDFFLSISVMMQRPGRPPTEFTAKISSINAGDNQSSPGMPKAKKMQVSYSCLAKGTKVQLADGKVGNIEDITRKTLVTSNSKGLALPVSDISVGVETIPMIRIADSAGRDLLLTGSHPIMTPDNGVMWAEELSVGSKVLTTTGVSTLVKVSREMYTDNVYNLKLDRSQLDGSSKGSTMFANGFLVGDLAMQKAYEFKNTKDLGVNVLSRLPAKWHTDYVNSLKVAAR